MWRLEALEFDGTRAEKFFSRKISYSSRHFEPKLLATLPALVVNAHHTVEYCDGTSRDEGKHITDPVREIPQSK